MGSATLESFFLRRPRGFQLVEAGGFAGPFVVNPLAELVHQRPAFQQRIAGIFPGQPDGANLQRYRAHGIGQGHADLAHRSQRPLRTRQVDPHHGPRFVVDRGHVVPLAGRLRQESQRHGAANPGARQRGQTDRANALRVVHAKLKALRRRDAQFQHQKAEGAPVGWQIGIEILDLPGSFRAGALENGAPGFSADEARRCEQRGGHGCPSALHVPILPVFREL